MSENYENFSSEILQMNSMKNLRKINWVETKVIILGVKNL